MNVVTSTKELKDLCHRWIKDEPYITVDTEFVRTKTFYAQLCLVQVGCSEGAVAIDVLASKLDFTPFFEVLKAKKLIKVFHAGRQDLEIFYQMGKVIPAPIFDTQVAAMVCGYGESAGYDTLVKSITGHSIDKSQRFTDWCKRPLHDKQIKYALDDVIYLKDVYLDLKEKLEKNRRIDWLVEEMKVLTSPETYQNDPEQAWKRLKARSHNRRFLARVRALAKLREETAQSRNVPRNRVYDDKTLLQLAAHAPMTPKEFDHATHQARFLRDGKIRNHIIASIKQVEKIKEDDLPSLPQAKSNGHAPPGSVDLLKVLLKERCHDAGVASKLVATAADIEEFAKGSRDNCPFLKGWRYSLFGRHAEALMTGKLSLTLSRKGLVLDGAKKH